MYFRMKRTAYKNSRTKNAFLHYLYNTEVIVYTDIYAYDGVDLVVDLGSALGLWLGAVNINLMSQYF